MRAETAQHCTERVVLPRHVRCYRRLQPLVAHPVHRVDERRLEAARELVLGGARTHFDTLPAALRRGERRWGCGRALGCAHAWHSGDVLRAVQRVG